MLKLDTQESVVSLTSDYRTCKLVLSIVFNNRWQREIMEEEVLHAKAERVPLLLSRLPVQG